MTIWRPELGDDIEGPLYRALADAVARDVASGALAPGDRLPTHRELARRLDVTIGTVSRGYAEAARRGLVVGEVGRGTFVRQATNDGPLASISAEPSADDDVIVELGIALPATLPGDEEGDLLSATLGTLASEEGLGALLRYRPDSGLVRHRRAAADWIARTMLELDPDRVTLTAGVQHALTVLMASYLEPGEVLLAGELTYPGARAAAERHGVRIRGVELDDEGIVPEALERACRRDPKPRALYLIPTIQNPTGGTLGDDRRREIAEIARAADLRIFEDDLHGLLVDEPRRPVSAYAPERGFYLTSLTKSVAMGLRAGFVAAPEGEVERVRAGLRASLWMAPPLMAEVASRWIEDGTAERIRRRKRAEAAARQRLAAEVLQGWTVRADPHSYYLWIDLPEGWSGQEVTGEVGRRGVRVVAEDAFATERGVAPGLRLALGVPATHERMVEGLRIVDEVLSAGPASCVVL